MNTLDGFAILAHNQNILLQENEQDAYAILKEFFEFYEKESPKEILWFILVQALRHDSESVTALHRSNMIFFYEYCLALFKAAQLLNDNYQNDLKGKD